MSERLRILHLADGPSVAVEGTLFPADLIAHPTPEFVQLYAGYLFAASGQEKWGADISRIEVLGLTRTGVLWNPLARLKVLRLFHRIRPEAVIVRGPGARTLALPIANSLGISSRIVVSTDMAPWLSPSNFGGILRANQHATQFVTDSAAATQRLMRQERVNRDRISLMRWGVETSRFGRRTEDSIAEAKHRMGLSSHQPVVLAAGSFSATDDANTLLYAIRQLLPHQPNVRLILWSGREESEPRLFKSAAKRHGVTEHVIFPPPAISFEECIAAADVGVVTSYVESCSPYMLLYMAAGLPVAAVDVAGNAELIRHGESGYLVDFKDADQLAMFITILLLSPELSERFGAAAREHVRQSHPYEAALRAREDFYRALHPLSFALTR